MCFHITKLWCFGLHNWVFLFSLICPYMLCLKEKYAKKNKSKKNQNAFNMVTSVFLGDVGVIGCTSTMIVPIKQLWLYVSVFDSLMSQIFIIWDTYALLLCFTLLILYFVHPWFACRTLKNPKISFTLHGIMRKYIMVWHNSFGHRRAQSAFFGQNDQNTPSQTWVDQRSNKIKILTKKHFSWFYIKPELLRDF